MYRYFLFVLVFFLYSCHRKEPARETSRPRPVRAVRVEALGSITRQYTGIVEAKEFSTLAFKVPGTIIEMNVEEGQQVKKGKVLARLKSEDYRLQYATARTNFNTARSIYERNKRLLASDAVARQNMEIAEADYVQAKSAVDIARRTLDYTILSAPFKGFIEERMAENFEEVVAGQPIVKLVNPDNIEVRFLLPETSIQLLQIPRKIYVEFDSQKGKLFTSDIKEYVYASDGSGIPITLVITDEQFATYRKNVFPGFSCKVIWEIDNMISDKFIIPASAVLRTGGREYVWIVDPETMTTYRNEIRTSRLDDHILVDSGLNSEDIIVVAGVEAVKEGEKVQLDFSL